MPIKSDNGVRLVLFAEKEGRPDLDNFTSVGVFRAAGKILVAVKDRQQGRDQVLDCTGKLKEKDSRYRCVLDGHYSVPLAISVDKLKIFRDGNSGFFHFFVEARFKLVGPVHNRSNDARGWIELAPSKDWMGPNHHWISETDRHHLL